MGQSVNSKMNNGTNTDLLDYLSQFGIENNESTIENQQMSLIQQDDAGNNNNNTNGNSSTPTISPDSFTIINDPTTATTTTTEAPVTPITTREAIIDPIIDQFPSISPKRSNDNSSNNINTNTNTNTTVSAPVAPVATPAPRPIPARPTPVAVPVTTPAAHPAPVVTPLIAPITPIANATPPTRTSIKMVGIGSNNSSNITTPPQQHTGRKIQISLSAVSNNKGSMSIHVPQHNVTNGSNNATTAQTPVARPNPQAVARPAQVQTQASTDPALGIPESQYDYFFKLSGTEERFKNKWIETIEKAKISKKRNYVVHTIRNGRFRVTETGMEMLPTTIDTSQSSVTDLLSTQWN